jgi:hypothetical protein
MSNRILYIQHSQTERRTYLGGTTPDEHRELLTSGFRHDRLARCGRCPFRALLDLFRSFCRLSRP